MGPPPASSGWPARRPRAGRSLRPPARPGAAPVGGVVLDVAPPRGHLAPAPDRGRVASSGRGGAPRRDARLDLHGALSSGGTAACGRMCGPCRGRRAVAAVGDERECRRRPRGGRRGPAPRRDDHPGRGGASPRRPSSTPSSRTGASFATATCSSAPGRSGRITDPALAAAMDRLEALLAVPAPPPLAEAARAAGCPPEGVRALERAARIVVLEPDLAYAMSTYRDLAARALAMAAREPLTPAAYRDATGTSRKYVMAILEDLDRRAILRRTPDGHVPGPKAPRRPAAGSRDHVTGGSGRSSSPAAGRPGSGATSSPSRSTAARCSTTPSPRSGRSPTRSSWSPRPARAPAVPEGSASPTTRRLRRPARRSRGGARGAGRRQSIAWSSSRGDMPRLVPAVLRSLLAALARAIDARAARGETASRRRSRWPSAGMWPRLPSGPRWPRGAAAPSTPRRPADARSSPERPGARRSDGGDAARHRHPGRPSVTGSTVVETTTRPR